MLRILQTFDGKNLNDGTNYRAVILNPHNLPAAQPVFLAQANADSEDAGVYTVESGIIVISVQVKNYATRHALIAQLKRWMKRGTAGDLVVEFLDDGLDYVKACRVVNLVQDPDAPMYFIATLETGWTSWRAVNADTYAWNLSGTGGNYNLSLSGDDETPLSVTFELSAQPANGYLYQRYYQLINAPGAAPLGENPWMIQLDTAALVADTTNKCQINQVGGINNSVTTIPYDTVTGTIPNAGMGYVDSEQIKWTGKTGTTSGNLTGVTRGIGGTTAATHADNAEIKFSYMQANGADLRIFMDGKETRRWINGINTTTTKVWFNVNISLGWNLILKTAIDSSSPISVIEFAETQDTYNALNRMPDSGILVHGTEWIKYSGKDLARYRLNVTARGILGRTKQSHAVDDVFQFMEHVITVCYGNSGVKLPSSTDGDYDLTKPVFSLASSTNSAWVYTATDLFTSTTGRPGSFKVGVWVRQNQNHGFYNFKRNAMSGDPALGMICLRHVENYEEVVRLAWQFYRACGIDTTTFTGEKYRGTDGWMETAGLQYALDGGNYITAWNESTPTNKDTWEALGTHSAVDMQDAKTIRILFEGVLAAGAGAERYFEIQTGTINFVSANLPTGTLLTQQVSAQLQLSLSNSVNSDLIAVDIPMLLGLPLALDGEAKTVLYSSVNAHEAIRLNDESRAVWLRLQPGTNPLTVTSVAVGTLAATLSWFRRRF